MTTLYLVRHVQAEANLRREFHGHTDGNVTELGLKQAERLKERFGSVSIDAALCSDLTRASTTARTLLSLHPHTPLTVSPTVREIHAGVWEGHTLDEIAATYPDEFNGFLRMDFATRLGGGETIGECATRMHTAVADFVAAHPGKTLLLVSHGCALTALLSLYKGTPVALGTNGSVSRVDFDEKGRPTILSMGDVSHLEGVASPSHLNIGDDIRE